MTGRLVNGVLYDCSMATARASGMAFDSAVDLVCADARARADMRLHSARPRLTIDVMAVKAESLAQAPDLDRLP